MEYRRGPGGEPISILGYGCMRFTKKAGAIDMPKAEAEIMHAIKLGVNYFDTAYIYVGSEAALGEILKRNNCRKDVNIADKLPQYLIKSRKAIDKYFYEQLRRLQTDYIDYYLMHMVTDIASWNKMVSLGVEDWIDEKKQNGQIRHIGFSYHGNTEMFLNILDAYPWDFCQIQYNYMDENSQAGRKGLLAAAERNIPVIIMEPLRGGKLADQMPREAKDLIAAGYGQCHDTKEDRCEFALTPASLALRWLWNQPQVTCVLSGMNSIQMIDENVNTAEHSPAGSFTTEEAALTNSVKAAINSVTAVPCTGCSYCMPCPMGVDIPGSLRCYNISASDGKHRGRHEYIQTTIMRKDPSSASNCIRCGKCLSHCPQSIDIPAELAAAAKALETPFYKAARKGVQIFKLW